MNNNTNILVGKIVAFQGVRGDVRIQTYTAAPSDFHDLKIISNKFAPEDFKFVRVLPNSSVIIAHINGFEDRTSAEVLRGTELFVERDDLPQTGANEYYQTDLIGFDVVRDGKKLVLLTVFKIMVLEILYNLTTVKWFLLSARLLILTPEQLR